MRLNEQVEHFRLLLIDVYKRLHHVKTYVGTNIKDMQGDIGAIGENIDQIESEITILEEKLQNEVDGLQQEIDDLREVINGLESYFRGVYNIPDDLDQIEHPQNGDYAWVIEGGHIWNYNEYGWYDTDKPMPSSYAPPYDAIPEMNGVGTPGSSTHYARGDHVHGTDSRILGLTTDVDKAKTDISGLTDRVSKFEYTMNISQLEGDNVDMNDIGYTLNDVTMEASVTYIPDDLQIINIPKYVRSDDVKYIPYFP